MLNNDIEIPNESKWGEYLQQMLDIWVHLKKDEKNRYPDRPSSHVFLNCKVSGEVGETAREELRKTWQETLDWIRKNHCELGFSGVVKIPEGKCSPLNPSKEKPYELDQLGRNQTTGNTLIHLIEMQREPFVLAVNGKWGCGKTTFLNMWEHHLKDEGFRVIRFNAWENDFTKEPFVSVLCEIEQLLGSDFLKKLEQTATEFTRVGLGVLLKVLTAGFLSKEDFSTEVFADGKEIKTQEFFDAYKARKQLISGFKQALSKAVQKDGSNNPLIFIVDELDRCRPTYSIELLEQIKHLFGVREIVFVLALDKEQLGKSIQSVYGEIDTEGYLRRFIDLTYNLPEPSPKAFVCGILQETYLELYLNNHSGSQAEAPAGWIEGILDYLAPIWRFSLRDLEHIIRQIGFAIRMLQSSERLYPYLLVPLTCLRFYNEELYQKFMKGDLLVVDLLSKLPAFVHSRNKIYAHRTWALIEAAFYVLDQNNKLGFVGANGVKISTIEAVKRPKDVDDAIEAILSWTNRSYEQLDDKLDLINDIHKMLEVSREIS